MRGSNAVPGVIAVLRFMALSRFGSAEPGRSEAAAAVTAAEEEFGAPQSGPRASSTEGVAAAASPTDERFAAAVVGEYDDSPRSRGAA